jgi:hypothetical protein
MEEEFLQNACELLLNYTASHPRIIFCHGNIAVAGSIPDEVIGFFN